MKMSKMSLFVFLLSLCTSLSIVALVQADDAFVVRDLSELKMGTDRYCFNSSTSYYLFYESQAMVDNVFQVAEDLGLQVLRTWGFCDGVWLNDHCFQPEAGVYNESTFQRMDYIIYKAQQYGIKLIIPLVNNWGDAYGGIPQYAAWSPAAKAKMVFRIYNPGLPKALTIALKTGDNWTWHQALHQDLVTGWNELTFDLSAPVWMTPSQGPEFDQYISDLDNVKQLKVILFNYSGAGFLHMDAITCSPDGNIIWDGAEPNRAYLQGLGDWYVVQGESDATSINISTEQRWENYYSFRLDYNPSQGKGQAIWTIDTALGNHDVFFIEEECKTMYKNYVSYFLNRVNTITGVRYKDDPTILMWELINEPRCPSDRTGDTLYAWIEEMASYIKSIDCWFNDSGDHFSGSDFVRNNQCPNIDVCSFHLYPQDNGMTEEEAKASINDHTFYAKNVIGKPLYAGEFGWKVDRNASGVDDNILHDFASGTEGWTNHWGFNGNPEHVSNPSYDGNGAIKLNASFYHGFTGGTAIWYDQYQDLSQYDYISVWVRTPNCPQYTWFKLQLYTYSGDGLYSTWDPTTTEGNLSPNTWYEVKLDISDITGPADPSKIKAIGIQVKAWNHTFNGDVYIDVVKVSSESNNEMAERNRIYQEWYGLCDYDDMDGAGFWHIVGRRDDGSLYPDYDQYTVYSPEDTVTCGLIEDFSTA